MATVLESQQEEVKTFVSNYKTFEELAPKWSKVLKRGKITAEERRTLKNEAASCIMGEIRGGDGYTNTDRCETCCDLSRAFGYWAHEGTLKQHRAVPVGIYANTPVKTHNDAGLLDLDVLINSAVEHVNEAHSK